MEILKQLAELKRMGLWLVIALMLLVVVYFIAPQMVKVTAYKLSLLPMAVYVLYWLDRALNEKRPHLYFEEAAAKRAEAERVGGDQGAMMLGTAITLERAGRERLMRRTIFIAAGMIAVALGS